MQQNVQLDHLTTFRIGGAPIFYVRPRNELELRAAMSECRRRALPFQIMGGGSNLLIEDGRLPFAVIHVCSPGLDTIQATRNGRVRVGAGAPTARLLSFCKQHGLGGVEFLAGLPGTIGGAIAGNAGAWGRQLSDLLSSVCVITPDGGSRVIPRSDLGFAYRHSPLAGHVVLEAELQLQPRSRRLIAMQIGRYAHARARRHPMGQPSAGCIFKNPPSQSAGRLLDMCGLKGHRIGNAEVSPVHANFIVNRGDAKAQHVLELIEAMKRAVRERFGVDLELEVRHWAADSKVA